jgi:hypothetical protein
MREAMHDDLVVGDVRDQELGEIWNSERRKAVLERFIGGDLRSACRDCSLYVPRRGAQPVGID